MNCCDCDLDLKWQSKVIRISCMSLISLFVIQVCHFKTFRWVNSLDGCLTSEEEDNETYTVKRLSFMSFKLRSSFWAKESDK